MTDGDEAADPAAFGAGPAHVSTYEIGTERPSVALVEAIATVKDVDPVALEPLGRHVDLEALDALLQSSGDGREASVTVELHGVRAKIDGEGSVSVRQTGTGAGGVDT